MSDPVVDLLVGFEERFDRLGHDVFMEKIQTVDRGESTLTCKLCGRSAWIAFHVARNAWYLPDTKLDLKCPGGAA